MAAATSGRCAVLAVEIVAESADVVASSGAEGGAGVVVDTGGADWARVHDADVAAAVVGGAATGNDTSRVMAVVAKDGACVCAGEIPDVVANTPAGSDAAIVVGSGVDDNDGAGAAINGTVDLGARAHVAGVVAAGVAVTTVASVEAGAVAGAFVRTVAGAVVRTIAEAMADVAGDVADVARDVLDGAPAVAEMARAVATVARAVGSVLAEGVAVVARRDADAGNGAAEGAAAGVVASAARATKEEDDGEERRSAIRSRRGARKRVDRRRHRWRRRDDRRGGEGGGLGGLMFLCQPSMAK